MTRTGPTKKVDAAYAAGRMGNARAYLEAARDAAAMAGPGANANPIMSQIINAAIAYTDALTAKRKGQVNQRDHSAAVKLLREALGRELPSSQERRLKRLLEGKDDIQYGPRSGRLAEAEAMLADLEELAAWAERQFLRG